MDPGARSRSIQVLAHSPAAPRTMSGRIPRQQVPWGPWTNRRAQPQWPSQQHQDRGKWQEGQPLWQSDSRTSVPCRPPLPSRTGGGSGWSRLLTPQMARPSPLLGGVQAPLQQRVCGKDPHPVQRSNPTRPREALPAPGPEELLPFAKRLLAVASPWERQTHTAREGQEDQTPSSTWQMSPGSRRGSGRQAEPAAGQSRCY